MLAQVHRSGLWLLLGAFALLGLFAMHGLGGHGMHQAGPSGSHQAAGHTVDAQSELQARHACDGTCATDDTRAHPLIDSGSGDGDPWVMALCLAVLAAAAAMAAVLALDRPRLAVLQPPGLLRGLGVVALPARDRDPPRIHALSVQRC